MAKQPRLVRYYDAIAAGRYIMEKITVQTTVNEPIDAVWDSYTNPKHIVHWNHASDDWCCPTAQNDLRVGGVFSARMESTAGDEGFDFEGVYSEVEPHKRLAYTMGGADARKVTVVFEEVLPTGTAVSVSFDPENENPADMQKAGWQAILENFKTYTEKMKK